MTEEAPKQPKQDKHDSQGIEEVEHRGGEGDDLAQANVGDEKGHAAEQNGPLGVAELAGEHFLKGLRAGGDKPNGGLQAAQGDGGRQDQRAALAKVVPGNDGKGVAAGEGAVAKPLGIQSAALGAHQGGGGVDEGHKAHAHGSGLYCAHCHLSRLSDAQLTHRADDDNAEGQTG